MQNKTILTLGLTLLAAASVLLGNFGGNNEIGTMQEFQQWKQLHNKFYTAAEEQYRFQIFAKNLEFILEHNAAQQYSFELGINQFADLTTEEFEAQYLTLIPQERRESDLEGAYDSTNTLSADHFDSVNWTSPSSVGVPDAVEWTESLKIVVKNQGACGSCWAFTGIGALEAAFAQTGKKIYLSEQELVDCAHEAGYDSNGCHGGYINDVFKYSAKFGVTLQSEYPYDAVDGKCDQSKTPKYRSKSFIDVERNNEQALINAIAVRPVSVAINAGGIWFQFYKKGIFDKPCSGATINHGVLATGYSNPAKFYNIKNSWGDTWGEAGYIRLAYISAPEGQCGVQEYPSYPEV